MERTNFEKLRVYRLSEKLADELWKIVMPWGYFERDTVGKQLNAERLFEVDWNDVNEDLALRQPTTTTNH